VIYLVLLAVGFGAAAPSSGFRVPTGPETTVNAAPGIRNGFAHDLHVSHTRMVLEGRTVACRIRLFKDDLEKALRLYSRQDTLHLTEKARADSLFGAYFSQKVTLEANGSPVALTVSASGTEHDQAAQEIVWYVLQGESGAPVSRLGLLNGLMFELFRDQQNIVQLLREPGDSRQTLYFVSTDPRVQSISF
jgi:Domain of unknown function (DUF6702)